MSKRTLLDKWEMLQAIILDFAAHRKKQAPTGSTIAVAARLLNHYNNKTGLCCPKPETVAEAVGISERQVDRCIDILVERKWLTQKQQPNGTIHYKFNWDRPATGVHDSATGVRNPATGVHDSATRVKKRRIDSPQVTEQTNEITTDDSPTRELKKGIKHGNPTLPRNERESEFSSSMSGEQARIGTEEPVPSTLKNRVAANSHTSLTPADIELFDQIRHLPFPASLHGHDWEDAGLRAFIELVESGVDPQLLLHRATCFTAAKKNENPKYIPSIQNWFKKGGWKKEYPDPNAPRKLQPHQIALLEEMGLSNDAPELKRLGTNGGNNR